MTSLGKYCGTTWSRLPAPQSWRTSTQRKCGRKPLRVRQRRRAGAGPAPMSPTPPFTPRAAGSYPQRQPTSSLASWFDAGSSSADYRPRTVYGGHGRPRITRRFFVGEGALQPDRARGRERVVAKTTVGCPKHYDVMLDADDGVEYSGDHVRYRYVDFLTSRPLDDGAAAAGPARKT